jgi:DNA-directed RNA polymerase specialized sigma24 family protein
MDRWTELYQASKTERTQLDVMNFCRRSGRVKQDGEDAWQYALQTSFEKFDTFTGGQDEFRAWLFGIARNYLRKQMEKKTRRMGFWVSNKQVFRMKADAEKVGIPKWHEVVEEFSETTFTDEDIEDTRLYIQAFQEQRTEYHKIHPRRSSYKIQLKSDASRPMGKRGQIVFDLFNGLTRPVKTNALRPLVSALLERNGLYPQFKWGEFASLIEEV